MQRSLRSRLEDLEAQGTDPLGGMFIIRTFVECGPNGPIESDPIAVRNDFGWRLERGAAEKVEDFRARAELLAPRSAWGCARVIEEVTQPQASGAQERCDAKRTAEQRGKDGKPA